MCHRCTPLAHSIENLINKPYVNRDHANTMPQSRINSAFHPYVHYVNPEIRQWSQPTVPAPQYPFIMNSQYNMVPNYMPIYLAPYIPHNFQSHFQPTGTPQYIAKSSTTDTSISAHLCREISK
ncbi:unnamed protein product [Owenia fusiformis]|uniref:Uncharacterized protein n=1 Tax=Owenia fusiformis TaxID=6347 RepID=A0A8S4PTM0_OWEFU|nr:unnamed protein product [Owenia fusiformis]